MSDPTNYPFAFAGEIVTEEALVKAYVKHVLNVCEGNKTKAARLLGIDRRSLYRRLGDCPCDNKTEDAMVPISEHDDEPYGGGV